MELRIIGQRSPYAGPDEATVGYVLEGESGHLILECGSGVTAKYLHQYDLADLEGVMISHLHPDHFVDLFPLGFAIKHAQMQGIRSARVPLFLPPGGVDLFNDVLGWLGDLSNHYAEVFVYEEYHSDSSLEIGAWKVHFHRVYHGMNCHGVVVEGPQGQRLGYTGDTKMGPQLASFFRGNDVLLCEATVESEEEGARTGHLTAEQAGILAADAEIDHLVLTHFLPGTDEREKQRAAARHFMGKITVAQAGQVYAVERE
ncbi:MAG: MBL fold metallo-hydrolase [Firmicutes bacterium]|nr:MBL fold metallo-hydrolase [Bacillota bacterium]